MDMHWVTRHRRSHSTGATLGWQRLLRVLAIMLPGAACLAIAACGSPSALQLPAGSYSSATYDFHVAFPRNWKANPYDATPSGSGSPQTAIPFTLVITRTGDTHSVASLISTCTITVMNMKDSNIAKSAARLADDNALEPATIGGMQGYKSKPVVQNVPNTQVSVTHTDYYIVHGDYEYQLSTDAVSSDHADSDLQSIIASFAFGA